MRKQLLILEEATDRNVNIQVMMIVTKTLKVVCSYLNKK